MSGFLYKKEPGNKKRPAFECAIETLRNAF